MHELHLWNGYMHPHTISLNYIETLSIYDCVKLLAWIDRYSLQLDELVRDTRGDTQLYYIKVKSDFETWKNDRGNEK